MIPMFNWDAIEDSDGDGDGPSEPTKLSSDAPVFVPSFIPGPPPKPQAEDPISADPLNAGLSATAAPFQPHSMPFDPSVYTWSSNAWAAPWSESEGSKGKGKSKGKNYGKGKSERENGKGKWKGKGDWAEDNWWGEEWYEAAQDLGKGKRRAKGDDSQAHESREESDSKPDSKSKSWKKQQLIWRPKTES